MRGGVPVAWPLSESDCSAARRCGLPLLGLVRVLGLGITFKHGKSLFAMMTKPGLWLQRITTQPPSDDQVECAIKALHEAMELEKKNGGNLVIA